MTSTLILVADESRARLFSRHKRGDALHELSGVVDPEARQREQDLVTDKAGGNPHDQGHQGTIHQHLAQVFARTVVRALDEVVAREQPERVVVIAAPHFLGLLRPQYSTAVKALLDGEFDKDLSGQSAEEIREHLAKWE